MNYTDDLLIESFLNKMLRKFEMTLEDLRVKNSKPEVLYKRNFILLALNSEFEDKICFRKLSEIFELSKATVQHALHQYRDNNDFRKYVEKIKKNYYENIKEPRKRSLLNTKLPCSDF